MRKWEKSFKMIGMVRLGGAEVKLLPRHSAEHLLLCSGLHVGHLHYGFISLTCLSTGAPFHYGFCGSLPYHYFITPSENWDTAFHGFLCAFLDIELNLEVEGEA